jgi:putative nucleotidyltransferase with HDIG domain
VRISAGLAQAGTEGLTDIADLWAAASQALALAKHRTGNATAAWSAAARDELLASDSPRRMSRDPQVATMLALATALDLRDAYTARHSSAVGRYAEQMAVELGLGPARCERVRLAGILHDIGKIGVPDAVLNKPAKLTDEEWELMRRHPEIGAGLMDALGIDDVRSWVLAHHERPDGLGYPAGLALGSIPLEARILAVADTYEALTSDRVYRAAPGPQAAREELLRCRDTQFDPAVVDAFVRVLDRHASGLLARARPGEVEAA